VAPAARRAERVGTPGRLPGRLPRSRAAGGDGRL